jgi:hypothetical protein
VAVIDDQRYRASARLELAAGRAPRNIGRPQNFVSRSLWMRTCLTYRVSGGSAIGGISWTISTRAGVSPSVIQRGVLYRLPGFRLHCCPSPRSGGSFTTWPSDRRKVSYRFSRACTQYRPAGNAVRLRTG